MEKQVCTNCKYYKQHYVLSSRGTFTTTRSGHCVHLKINNAVAAKHVKKDEGCDLWQPYELQKLCNRYIVELRLQRISQDIANILSLLRDVK